MMTENEKLDMIKKLLDVGDSEDRRIAAYLNLAEKEILNWRYSSAPASKPKTVPEEYETTLIHAVVAGYSISGAEGQTAHSENGISRTFKYADMVAYIRSNVIPYCGVM